MQYIEPDTYSREQIAEIIEAGSAVSLSDMLVGIAFNENDLRFAYDTICSFLDHSDFHIVGLSIICLAHLTRIHSGIPELETIKRLRHILNSKNAENNIIKGRMGDAMDDFSVYQKPIYDAMMTEFPEYFKSLGF